MYIFFCSPMEAFPILKKSDHGQIFNYRRISLTCLRVIFTRLNISLHITISMVLSIVRLSQSFLFTQFIFEVLGNTDQVEVTYTDFSGTLDSRLFLSKLVTFNSSLNFFYEVVPVQQNNFLHITNITHISLWLQPIIQISIIIDVVSCFSKVNSAASVQFMNCQVGNKCDLEYSSILRCHLISMLIISLPGPLKFLGLSSE